MFASSKKWRSVTVRFVVKKATGVCNECGIVSYCSENCQRADWRRHRRHCHRGEENVGVLLSASLVSVATPIAAVDREAVIGPSEAAYRDLAIYTIPVDFVSQHAVDGFSRELHIHIVKGYSRSRKRIFASRQNAINT